MKNIFKKQNLIYILAGLTGVIMLFFAFVFDQSPAMIAPFLISLVVRIFSPRLKRFEYLIGGCNAIFYGLIFLSYRLYGLMLASFLIGVPLQLFIFWSRGARGKITAFRTMSKKLRVLLIPLFAVVYSIYTTFVFIKVGDANAVFFDSAILILYLLSTVIYLLRYSEFTYLGFLCALCEIVVYAQMIALGAEEMASYLVFAVFALICTLIQISKVKKSLLEQR